MNGFPHFFECIPLLDSLRKTETFLPIVTHLEEQVVIFKKSVPGNFYLMLFFYPIFLESEKYYHTYMCVLKEIFHDGDYLMLASVRQGPAIMNSPKVSQLKRVIEKANKDSSFHKIRDRD